MTELRVLGIGSPFGDDQLGWEVVQLLEQCSELSNVGAHRLQLMCCDRPGMHLLELMREAKTVYLIDAVKAGSACGTLHRYENQAIETIDSPLSSHMIGVAYALKMARALDALPPHVILYGIDIGQFNDLSRRTRVIFKAIHTLAEQIKHDILNHLKK